MIYILDHHDAVDHIDFCKIINSSKQPLEVIEICSVLQFLFEDVTGVKTYLDIDCLLNILKVHFDASDIKDQFKKQDLEWLPMPIKRSIFEKTELPGYQKVCLLDLKDLKSIYSNSEHRKLLTKWIGKESALKEITESMRTYVSTQIQNYQEIILG